MGTDRRKGTDRRTKKRRSAAYYQEMKAKKARLSEDTQHSNASSATEPSTSGQVDSQPSSSTTTTTTSATPLSASERKLNFMLEVMSYDSEIKEDPSSSNSTTTTESDCTSISTCTSGFRLIDIEILNQSISEQLSCKFCQGHVMIKEVSRTGLHSEFIFTCKNLQCKAKKTTFPSSSTSSTNNIEHCSVNRRAAFAMRTIGCDRAELEKFCGVMDLPPPVHKSSYAFINQSIAKAAEAVQAESMTNAAKEEWELAEPGATLVRDIDASGGKFFL